MPNGRLGELAWEAGGGWRTAGSEPRAAGGGRASFAAPLALTHTRAYLALDLEVDMLRALSIALALDGLRLAVTHCALGALREFVPPLVLRPSPLRP